MHLGHYFIGGTQIHFRKNKENVRLATGRGYPKTIENITEFDISWCRRKRWDFIWKFVLNRSCMRKHIFSEKIGDSEKMKFWTSKKTPKIDYLATSATCGNSHCCHRLLLSAAGVAALPVAAATWRLRRGLNFGGARRARRWLAAGVPRLGPLRPRGARGEVWPAPGRAGRDGDWSPVSCAAGHQRGEFATACWTAECLHDSLADWRYTTVMDYGAVKWWLELQMEKKKWRSVEEGSDECSGTITGADGNPTTKRRAGCDPSCVWATCHFTLIHRVCEETATVSRHRDIVGLTLPPGRAIEARWSRSLSYTGCGQSASVTLAIEGPKYLLIRLIIAASPSRCFDQAATVDFTILTLNRKSFSSHSRESANTST